jgi:NAD(P)-dependent dehydrogenase (short-subunit alcohol dehydrogenase family)
LLDFGQRVALVTGAGQGMGRAHALTLSARGARVMVNDLSPERAQDVVAEIEAAGGTALPDAHDVATDAAAIVSNTVDHFGRLDVVISNAAVLATGMFDKQDPSEFWRVFEVSFRGTVEVSRAAWPHLVASGNGRLILVSSSGIMGNPGAAAYSSAKGAIWALANTLAMEGAGVGVYVNAIMPTAWTPMTEGAFSDPTVVATLRDRMGPEHVAALVTYLAHQDTTLQGNLFQVSGGRASRMVVCSLPRVEAPESTPEGWRLVGERLLAPSGDLTPYWTTGDHFAAEMVAANPDVAEALANTNPADVNS